MQRQLTFLTAAGMGIRGASGLVEFRISKDTSALDSLHGRHDKLVGSVLSMASLSPVNSISQWSHFASLECLEPSLCLASLNP